MTNQMLISEIEEIPGDVGDPDCRLTNPYIINQSSGEIEGPWMQGFAKPGRNWFEIHSDKMVTFFTPKATLLEQYAEELVK